MIDLDDPNHPSPTPQINYPSIFVGSRVTRVREEMFQSNSPPPKPNIQLKS